MEGGGMGLILDSGSEKVFGKKEVSVIHFLQTKNVKLFLHTCAVFNKVRKYMSLFESTNTKRGGGIFTGNKVREIWVGAIKTSHQSERTPLM